MTRSPDRSRTRRGARPGRLLAVLTGLALLLAGLTAVASPASAAVDPCGPSGNKVACENSLPGTPASVWDIDGAGDPTIQGFATDISVNVGQKVDFKIDTAASAYSITIYRTGYYNGDGARRIASVTPSATLPQKQPACLTDAATELYDCGNWAVSASWNVPSTAVSGVYIAKLTIPSTGDSSHITFVVRDDSSHSDVVFQTSDPTWQAYNTYGGADYYQGGDEGRAFKLSYNRPVTTRTDNGGRDFFFANEYPMVRFLEKNGYDVSYLAGVDSDRNGALLKNHKTFVSAGHDEYWSAGQRANVEAARDAGVNLMFLSGNEVYWKTRYEPSTDASATAYRTLVCYKETWAGTKSDPSPEWTGTWRDPRFAPRSSGAGSPENALTGTMYMVNNDDLAVSVDAREGKLRLWRNTSLASMSSGTTAALAPHTIGYESDEDVDNGFRPAGLVRLSTTTGPTPQYLQDFGNTVAAGTTTHHLTMYRAPSGALVFSAGTVQWTWGLDATHDSSFAPEPADPRMQQAQVNLLADMGAQPVTLDPALVPATKSTDTTGPTVSVTSPAANAARANGERVTVTGTATDDVGRVAGVEYSTDAGTTWHPATGTTSWSFDYIQHGSGSVPIRVRAVDDSANIGATSATPISVSCPCSVFGAETPQTPDTNDPSAGEFGLRFSPTTDGFVNGVRFYKGTGNTGTHTGSLWGADGQRLAQVTFTNESATGWQSASFDTPVAVAAGQTYVVSYAAPNGHYASKNWAFAYGPPNSDPLKVAGGFGVTPAGVYGGMGQFPTNSYQNGNYYVDPLFTTVDQSPLRASNQWPVDGSSSVPSSTTVSATFSKPVDPATVALRLVDANGAQVAGSTAYDATSRTVTFTPDQPLAGYVKHTVTLSGTDTQGGTLAAGGSWSFTTAQPPAAPGVCPCTLFDDTTLPSVLDTAETSPVTLGVRFSSDVAGTITGVRFYKGLKNTGTHTGALWGPDGTQLAQGTFTGESTSGWQTLTFAQPVAIAKGTAYTVSYRTTVGHYSVTPNAFGSADLSRPPLRVGYDAGAYTYGTGFPSAASSSSYLVDPVFERAAPELSIAGSDPASGATDIPRAASVRVSFSNTLAPGWSMAVTDPGGAPIPGSAALDSTGTELVFTPSGLMPASTDIRVSLARLSSTDGAAMADTSWTFRTRGPDSATAQSLFGDYLPDVVSQADSSPVELGVVFSPTHDGQVTGVRFFKGTGNLGTHVGSLWSAAGDRLAQVTFAGESASGWQTAMFATPVDVTAGTRYVVSYLAPQGHYSSTAQFFRTAFSSGQLVAPAENNGRYLYGAAGGFPQYSYGSANYFVDVVFAPSAPTVSITDRDPAPGDVDVPQGVAPRVTFSAPLAAGYALTATAGGSPVPGTVKASDDRTSLTFTPTDPLPLDSDVTLSLTGAQSDDGAVLPATTWTFHTETAASVLTSLLTGAVPDTPSVDDNGPIELGMAFSTSQPASVTHIRFYKGTGNTGTHTGSIWTASGTRLATVTFTGETASGWQSARLASPLALVPGDTYVVSYLAPRGHYSATAGYFGTPRAAGPLSTPAQTNGRYLYAADGGFPTASWNATNYFVDVVVRSAAP